MSSVQTKLAISAHPDDPSLLLSGESLEDFISRCVSQFKYEESRNVPAKSTDINRLELVIRQINEGINTEANGNRHVCLMHILQLAYTIHHYVYRLRQFRNDRHLDQEVYNDYVIRIKATLDELVRDSYDDEKRKLEVVFGLVDAIAELFITELAIFGVNPDAKTHEEAKTIRKFIASLLTNLVFGNAPAKRRLTTYNGFIDQVTRVIRESPNLTVFYAALVRNLSWMADHSMKQHLTIVVPALTLAAVRAHANGDTKGLLATLSALWNLGSHSLENKKAICEGKKFLPLVISLLDCEPANTVMVENASGILKYACAYLTKKSELLAQAHNAKLVRQLLVLLNSPSFTVVLNALSALSHLTEQDPQTQMKLIHNVPAMQLFERLRNSTREDIRNTVRVVLTNLHSSPVSGYTYSMPSSARAGAMTNSTPAYYHGGHYTMQHSHQPYGGMTPGGYAGTSAAFGTLPRTRGGFPGEPQFSSTRKDASEFSRGVSVPPPNMSEVDADIFLRDVTFEAGHNIPESLLGTRSGSVQSLVEDLPAGETSWQSSVNTDAQNSSTEMSPVSVSEIPDSPTEFAAKQAAKQFGMFNLDTNDAQTDPEGYYGMFNSERTDEALSRAITDALPKSSTTTGPCSLQSTPRLPKPAKKIVTAPVFNDLPRSPDCGSDIDFDESSIVEEPSPPRASATSSLASTDGSSETTGISDSKNYMSEVSTATSGRLSLRPRSPAAMTMPMPSTLEAVMAASSLLQSPSTMEKLRDASRLVTRDDVDFDDDDYDEGALSDDSYCGSSADIVQLEDLTAVPHDIDAAFQAEKLIIDCGSLSRPGNKNFKLEAGKRAVKGSEKAKNVKIGLLSAATIKRLSKSRNPLPQAAPSPASRLPVASKSAARVSPFNYKEPVAAERKPSTTKPPNGNTTGKILVTTV
uniref:TOG domain-containing protein n=1 Tax=Panagrellus redivivus TaxID=6233 RepID=A0A7E4W6B0_PANRE